MGRAVGILFFSRTPTVINIKAYTFTYGGGWLSVTCLVEALYILHHGKLTAVGGRFLYAPHLENVVFDFRGLPLRP